MLNSGKNFLFNHTPLFDLVNSVENHPSHERGIEFPFQRKGWQSRNEIDGVGLAERKQHFSLPQILTNIILFQNFTVKYDVS